MNSNPTQTVASFDIAPPAWILRNRLVSVGFDASVVDEYHVGMDWYKANALGGIKVQVPAAQYHRAVGYLDQPVEFEFPDFESNDELNDPQRVCPNCGSIEYSVEFFDRRLVLFTLFFMGVPLPITMEKEDCESCGFQRESFPQRPLIHSIVGWGAVGYFVFLFGWYVTSILPS